MGDLVFDFEEELMSLPPRRPKVEKKEEVEKEEGAPGEEEDERRPAPWPKAAAARPAPSKKEERSPRRPAVEFLEVRGEGRPRQTPKQEPSSSSAGPGTLVQRKAPPPPPPPPRPSSSVGQDVRAIKAQPLEGPSRPLLKATSKARPSSAVRPTTKGRSTDLTKEELSDLRTEQIDSLCEDVPWSERGPTDDDVGYWRGQPWRQGHMGGKTGYRKRGGKFAEHYAKLARDGRLMPTRHGAVVVGKGEATDAIRAMRERTNEAKGSKGNTASGSKGKGKLAADRC